MITLGPSIGVIALMRNTNIQLASLEVMRVLADSVTTDRGVVQDAVFEVTAIIRNQRIRGILHSYEEPNNAGVLLEFEEEEIINICRSESISAFEVFSGYLTALTAIPECLLVGIGFELSMPQNLEDKSLERAGICIYFTQNDLSLIWERKDLLPLVGHPY